MKKTDLAIIFVFILTMFFMTWFGILSTLNRYNLSYALLMGIIMIVGIGLMIFLDSVDKEDKDPKLRGQD